MVIRNAVRMMKTMCQKNVHFLYKRSFVTLKMTADWMSLGRCMIIVLRL